MRAVDPRTGRLYRVVGPARHFHSPPKALQRARLDNLAIVPASCSPRRPSGRPWRTPSDRIDPDHPPQQAERGQGRAGAGFAEPVGARVARDDRRARHKYDSKGTGERPSPHDRATA